MGTVEGSVILMNLTTITDLELLRLAYHSILDRYQKEFVRKEAGSVIAEKITARLFGQLEEINAKIIEFERLANPDNYDVIVKL